MERTIGNARPQDEQINCPSVTIPLFWAEASDSARRGAPHPMHLSHSTELKFISSSNSSHQIRAMRSISRTHRIIEILWDNCCALSLWTRNQFIGRLHQFLVQRR